MEDTTQQINTPLTSSGRLLKTEGRTRSFSEERIRFIEEEYDVKYIDLWMNYSFCVMNYQLGYLLYLIRKFLQIL